MALATPLTTPKKKMVMSVGLMLLFQYRKTTNCALKNEANARKSSVRELCKQGRLKEALYILHVMDQRLDCSTYDCLLQWCLNNKALSEGKLIHAHMIQTGFKCQDVSLGNKLVTVYAKRGSLQDARRVLDQMPERDVVSWTVIIAAYARHGFNEAALALFNQMQRTVIKPDHFTFASVLQACTNMATLKQVHEYIIGSKIQSDIFVENALVDTYAKCGSLEIPRSVFDKMPQQDVVSWNAMIAGYAQRGHVDEAQKLFLTMPERDIVSMNTMIAVYAQNGHLEEAVQLFENMPKQDVYSWNAMIAGYAQNGDVDEAMKLFQEMPERDMVSWTAMISGYAQNGHSDEALTLFFQMLQTGIQPNQFTYGSVLLACANLADIEHGKEVHEEIIRSGFHSDIFVGTALVDMYVKCSSIENARNVFDKMTGRNVVSWTAMIAGYAHNGCLDVCTSHEVCAQ